MGHSRYFPGLRWELLLSVYDFRTHLTAHPSLERMVFL